MTLLVMFVSMEQVGLYGFGIGWMAATLSGLAGARMVIERAMLLEAGHAGDDTSPARYHRYMQAPLVVNVLAAALSLGTMYFAFDWVVATFLPAFEPSMPVARVLLLGQLLYAVTSFPRLYFNATGQLTNRLWFALFGLGLNVVLDLVFLFAGYGILGVAIGATISYGVYAAVLLPACTAQIEGSTMSGVSFIVRLLLAASLAVLALTALSAWHPSWANATSGTHLDIWSRGVLLMLLKMAAYGAAAVMAYVLAFWRYRPDREVVLLLRHARLAVGSGRRA
jgi:hypothetical protein